MACISPLSIPRPNGKGSADRLTVPCGKCIGCLSAHRQDWTFRLKQELKTATSAVFLTLTYVDEHLPINPVSKKPEVSKIDVQLFLKRLRKRCPKVKLRYYLVSEYGPKTKRPHYHGIFFNLPFTEVGNEKKLDNLITTSWQKGFIKVGTVTAASIGYVTKYLITKNDENPGVAPVFSLMSRNPAIGSNYLNNADKFHKQDNENKFYTVREDGSKGRLPRYYRDKIFSDVAKERNSAQVRLEQNLKMDEAFNDLIAKGENPFLNDLENKKQLIDRMRSRINKNAKL